MNADVALFWVQETLQTTFLMAAPILGIALVVGLTVSLVQAITSVQEMTLSYVPKMLAVGLIILVLGSWMLTTLSDFAISVFQYIPNVSQ